MSIAHQIKQEPKPTELPIKKIRIDGGTQPRIGIDDQTVDSYAEAIGEGASFPPVTVFHDGTDYWLADGFHRFRAHQTAGKTKIAVDVRQGTQRDAVLFSVGANATHGKPRCNEDKRRSVLTLLNDKEWSAWSDGEIAKRCAVSREYVNRLRPTVTCDQVTSERSYVTKHGSVATMNVSAIGRAETQPDSEADEAPHALAPTADPDSSVYEKTDEDEPASQEDGYAALREQHYNALPQEIKDLEERKAAAIEARKGKAAEPEKTFDGLTAEERIAELEETVRILEQEAEELRAENRKYSELKLQYDRGGFAAVVAGKDEEIRVLLSRVEQESDEKVINLRRGDSFLKILNERYNHFKTEVIDLETGEVTYE